LAIGAHQAQSTTAGAAALHSDQPPLSTLTISLGVAVTCMAGVAYGLLGVVIRGTVGNTAPMSSMLLVICTTGVVVLGGASLRTIGPAGMLATAPADWAMMLLAGTFNAVAFLALTKALHLTNVVRVNLINGSQNAMAAVAGVLIFGEPWTIWLGLGVALTLVGLAMMRRK
jgi:drug/metabolite transporter (DMT)-like permease